MIDIENIKKEIVQRLKPINANKIILFGSYAYGTPNKDSDLDIMILKQNYNNKWEEIKQARKYLKNIRVPKDILVEKVDYFQSHIDENWINSVWYEANKYGEILYAKE